MKKASKVVPKAEYSLQRLSEPLIDSGLSLPYYARATWATTRRTLLENLRAYRWSFFASRLLSSLFNVALAYLLYHTLFESKTALSFQAYTGSNDYLAFVVIGVSIQAYVSGALLNLGRSLITERRLGTLESLFLSPIPHSAYLTGVMLQQTLLTGVDFLIIMIVSVFCGASFAQANWPGFVLALLIGHIGFMGMAVILGSVMLYLRDTYLTQNTVMLVLYLICGVFFPIQYLPGWVQAVARLVPLTHTLSLARNSALLGHSPKQQGLEFLVLLVLSLLYCIVGLFLVAKVRRVALEVALS